MAKKLSKVKRRNLLRLVIDAADRHDRHHLFEERARRSAHAYWLDMRRSV